MAQLVHINRSVPAGSELYSALIQIRNGFAKLEELNGLKNEAIGQGDNAVTMQSVFGTNTTAEAQALSDRWGALLAAFQDSGNAEYAKLRDIINTLVSN